MPMQCKTTALPSLHLFGSIWGANGIDTTFYIDMSCAYMSTFVTTHENTQIIPKYTGRPLQVARYNNTVWSLRFSW